MISAQCSECQRDGTHSVPSLASLVCPFGVTGVPVWGQFCATFGVACGRAVGRKRRHQEQLFGSPPEDHCSTGVAAYARLTNKARPCPRSVHACRPSCHEFRTPRQSQALQRFYHEFEDSLTLFHHRAMSSATVSSSARVLP